MKRLYDELVKKHFEDDDTMLFLSGPRQVGKTTTSIQSAEQITSRVSYFNWDNDAHRDLILRGQDGVINFANIHEISERKPILIFDEIHKFPDWKNFIKGLFDTYHQLTNILITGSSRLDIYKKGGDSLMGRYFPYRMHPLSLCECMEVPLIDGEVRPPSPSDPSLLTRLLKFGGFPMPYLKQNPRFSSRWHRLRLQQLFREDIRDLRALLDINQLEILGKLLIQQAAEPITYSSLSKKIRVTVDTISRWVEILESFYFCFLIRPWSKNISRSLIKEPKIFLWDWSVLKDTGKRTANFIASHLLKAVHYWTDVGLGEYGLYYLRDLEKREVDFIVTKNEEPWFLVEVKTSENAGISKSLYHFFEQSGAKHAFQVDLEKPFVNKNCFEYETPVIVPAATLLSQLV